MVYHLMHHPDEWHDICDGRSLERLKDGAYRHPRSLRLWQIVLVQHHALALACLA